MACVGIGPDGGGHGPQLGSRAAHRGLGRLFPKAWQRFRDAVPVADRDGDLADAYHRLLCDPDLAVREKAARDWCEWEEAMVPTSPPNPRYQRPEFRMAFARIVTHYWRNGHWLEDGIVLRHAGLLAGIPGVIVQGSIDLGNLLGTAWELTHAWPDCGLVLVNEAGHDAGDPGITDSLVAATDRFR